MNIICSLIQKEKEVYVFKYYKDLNLDIKFVHLGMNNFLKGVKNLTLFQVQVLL